MPFYDDYDEFSFDSLYEHYDLEPEQPQYGEAPEPDEQPVSNYDQYMSEPVAPIDTFVGDVDEYGVDELMDQYDIGGEDQRRWEEAEAADAEETRQSLPEQAGRAFGRAGENIRETVWSVLQLADKLPYAAAMALKKRTDPEGYKVLKENEEITKRLYKEAVEGTIGEIAGEALVENPEFQRTVDEALTEIDEYRSGAFGKSDIASKGISEGYKDIDWWTENTSDVGLQLAQVIGLNSLAPGAGLAAIGTQGGAGQYQEAKRRMKERGFDANDAEIIAAGEGVVMGLLEAAMEYVPATVMARVPGGKAQVFELAAQKYLGEAGGRLAVGMGGEALQEVGSEFAGDIMELVAENDPEAFNNWKERYVQAGALGAVGGGLGGAPGAAADIATGPRRTDEDIADLLETSEGRAKLRALGEIESPSRKDFAEAGFTSRMNKEQREAVSKGIPNLLQQLEQQELDASTAAREAKEKQRTEAPETLPYDEYTEDEGNVFPQEERDIVASDIKRSFGTDSSLGTAAAAVVQSALTKEEVEQLHFERGGKGEQEPGALYQIPEAVDAALKDPDHKSTTDEKKFFGEMWPKAIAAARKGKGFFKGATGLAPASRKQWADTVAKHAESVAAWEAKGKKGQKPTLKDPFKSGEQFEKTISMAGLKKGVAEAVKDLIPFVKNKPEFQEYYRNEVQKEREAVAQKHPELATDDAAFQFYRMLNGVASAQTELFKNTQETERAYAGFKQSGRLPVVVDETGSKPRPQYALPKDNEFGATLPGEIDSIAEAIDDMHAQIPADLREKLTQKERLSKPDQTKLKQYAKKFKDRMNTTSDDLAANLWHEWARAANPEAFKGKVRTAFEIAGGSSAYNKARNYHVVNKLLDKFDGDLGKLMEFLNERISINDLKALNKEVGFAENIGGLADIKDTVWVAEGQETKIPRTFIFGPKVGAYILNRMADAHPQNANYNTMDVWESRVWRSYYKDLADDDLGIASGVPRRVYMRAAREFPAEFKKQTGMDVSVSAGQAARWYFGMEMMRKAGYAKVGDKQTIARYTQGVMEEYMRQELGAANPDMVVLENALNQIREAGTKADKEAIAERAELFKGSQRKLGKEVQVKKLTKKQQKEEEGKEAMRQLEAEGKRAQVQKEAREKGPTTTVETVQTPTDEISSVTTLFQKSEGKVLGLMREDADGKIILKGFEGSNVDTALEEIAHGIRRLVWRAHEQGGENASGLTNAEIKAIERWAGKPKKGEKGWSVRMEERFAAGARRFIVEGEAPNPHLKTPFAKLRNFLKKLYTRIKSPASGIRMNKEVEAAFAKLLDRRSRLTKPKKVRVTKLQSAPKSWPAPLANAHKAKKAYLEKMGMPMRRQSEIVKVDQEFKQRLADSYEAMPHDPTNQEVQEAYQQLAEETYEQWLAVEATGLHVEASTDDYDTPGEVHKDLRDNNHLLWFPTAAGFGEGPVDITKEYDRTKNPLLKVVPDVEIDGQQVTYNDLFRIVHDYFGHGLEGTSFGERGEENAWQAHVRMFSPKAARAMTTETRGQNSWVNVQPENKAKPGSVFAPQKTGLLPEWAMTERVAPDAGSQGQKADDAAEGAAATQTRGFKDGPNETTKGDTREQQAKALDPRRSAVDQDADSGAAIASKGGETVPPEFIKEGKVSLYRYSKGDRGESYTIDPAKTVPSGYSRNEYQRAQTPRTFFYLNTSEKEGIVGNNLYIAEVNADDIYNLITDPDGLKPQFKDGASYDFDGIFAELQRRGKKGVYYNPGFHVVNLFEAVEGRRAEDAARKVDKQKSQEIWRGVQKQIRQNEPAGFTFNPRTGEFPVDGYAVAPAKSGEYVIDLDTTKAWEIPALIQEYAGMHADKLAEGDMHLGGWVSDGKLYLDTSYVVPGKNVAIKIAKDNDQLAIFDLGSGKDIDTSDADSAASIYPNQREDKWTRVKGELKGEPLSKTAVVDRILGMVGLKAGGNMSGKPPTVQGYYRKAFAEIDGSPAPGVEINMRRKELANIGVAIHEVAHYLDDKLGLTDLGKFRDATNAYAAQLSDTERMYLTQESYEDPGNQTLKEGFAEALRLYIMNENGPTGQGFRSQHAHSAFERFLNDPQNKELNTFVKEARGLVEQYMRQPNAAKIQAALATSRSRIVDPGASYFARKGGAKQAMRWLEKKFANNLADLEAAEREIERRFKEWWVTLPDATRGGKDADQAWADVLSETGGLPSQMRQNHSNLTAHLTDKAIFEELTDADGNKYADGASKIFEDFDKQEIQTFGQYMYAKVALQRHDASEIDPLTGRPSYVPGEVDIADLREFVRQVENPKFQKAAKETTNYFNSLLRMMKDKNLILQHEYDSMVATHQLYMPFYRQFADENHGLGGRFLGVQAPIKKLKGGSVMPVLDVYDAIIDRTHEVIGAVNRREVEQTFVDVFEKSGVSGIFMSRVEKKSEGGPNVVTILRNGVEVHYKVDPDIYQAMVMSGNAQMAKPVAAILDAIGSLTSLGRKLLVNYNPLFPFRNYPRDFKTATIKSLMDTTGIDPRSNPWLGVVGSSMKIARRSTEVDKLYADMGGSHNTRVSAADRITSGPVKRLKKGFQKRRAFGKPSALTKAQVGFVEGLNKLEMLNEHLELVPRKAAFHATLVGLGFANKDGTLNGPVPQWAKTRAMSNAMEVTVNFNRRGEWAPVLGKMFLFYNAAMQGSWTSRGQILSDPKARKRLAASIAISFMAKGAALAAMASMPSPDDEERTMLDHYWEIPEYYKTNQDNMLFNVNGRVYGLQLPKEREWAPFSRLSEKIWEHMLGSPTKSDDPAILQVVEEMGDTLAESLPVTGGTVPTFLQLFFGYDLFRNKQIEGKWDDTKLVEDRYDKRTSSAAKFMSQNMELHNLGLSPKEMDFFLRSVGFGTFSTWGDIFSGKAGDKLPFMMNEAPRQSVSDFYVKSQENKQKLNAWSEGKNYSPKEESEILENEAVFGVAEGIGKAIRESSMSEEDKEKYSTGLTRWALGRNAVAAYPNPLVEYQSLPPEIKEAVTKAIKSLGRKPRLTEKTPEGVKKLKKRAEAKKRAVKRLKTRKE